MGGLKLLDLALITTTVLMMSAGQVLFKIDALRANDHQGYFNAPVMILLLAALAACAAATLVWIRVLQTVPLSLAYAFVALSFVVVPVLGLIVFRETLSLRFAIGAMIIVAGIVVAGGA